VFQARAPRHKLGNVLRQPLGPEADSSKATEVGQAPKGFKRRSINETPARSRYSCPEVYLIIFFG
jgi:hypothetical protein